VQEAVLELGGGPDELRDEPSCCASSSARGAAICGSPSAICARAA
jgi:hypothetical protein